jgi:hypothetical protein
MVQLQFSVLNGTLLTPQYYLFFAAGIEKNQIHRHIQSEEVGGLEKSVKKYYFFVSKTAENTTGVFSCQEKKWFFC